MGGGEPIPSCGSLGGRVIPGRDGGGNLRVGDISGDVFGDSPLSELLSCVSSSVVTSGDTFLMAFFPPVGPLPRSSMGASVPWL